MRFSIFLILGLLTSGSYSFSVIDNVTVPGDIISDLFYKEVLNFQDSSQISVRDLSNSYDTLKCIHSLKEIVTQFPSTKVLPFIDSWGKLPSGILYGNLYSFGHFDQCVRTSVILSDVSGVVGGQFCFLEFPLLNLKPANNLNERMPKLVDSPVLEGRFGVPLNTKINLGICLPDSCSPETINPILEIAISKAFQRPMPGVSVTRCTDGKRPPLKPVNIVGIVIFSIFGLLMLLSSLYEFFTNCFEKTPVPILLAFSVLTNGRKMFAINTKKSPNTIDCIGGMRVLSMMWVVYCHTHMFSSSIPLMNGPDTLDYLKSMISMPVINGTVSVDTFFFISGLLVAWLGFRELDRSNGKLNVIMMYVHRYIRLTPVVAAGLLYIFSINEIIGSGPFRQETINMEKCKGPWWQILLYVQNYLSGKNCFGRTWYLAVDFQLYVLSPLLLIPMWKWGKKFAPVLVVLTLMSIASVMAIYMIEGYTDLRTLTNKDEWSKTYVPMHTRCSPWLVGFAMGYFMHINRNRKFQISKLTQLLGWIVSFGILIAVIFGPYGTITTNDGQGTLFETAMYEGWKRVSWSIALAWITFACQFGFGGIIDAFLSHPGWQPMVRLNYVLYLFHTFVLKFNFGVMRNPLYFSFYNEILLFLGAFGIACAVAVAISLAFESPIIVLEKFIFGNGKPQQKPQLIEPSTSTKIVVE